MKKYLDTYHKNDKMMFQNVTKQTFIVIFIILFSSCYYIMPNAQKKNRDRLVGYYDSGKMEYLSETWNGQLDGVTKKWDKNGHLLSIVHYSNGSLHGDKIEYYKNGQIKYQVTYTYNQKHGYEIFYYDTGEKQRQLEYNYGELINKEYRWDANGNLLY